MENKLIRRKSSKKVIEEERLFSRNPAENIYLLELNENGGVDIPSDQYLRVPNFSRLMVRLFNGCHVSKNCFLITNYGTDLAEFDNIKHIGNGEDFSHLNRHSPIDINTTITFHIDLNESGGYFFQIVYEDENGTQSVGPANWIVIDPFYKIKNRSLDLSVISM